MGARAAWPGYTHHQRSTGGQDQMSPACPRLLAVPGDILAPEANGHMSCAREAWGQWGRSPRPCTRDPSPVVSWTWVRTQPRCKPRARGCLSFPSLAEEPGREQCPRRSARWCWHCSPSVAGSQGPREGGAGPESPPTARGGARRPRSTWVLLRPGGCPRPLVLFQRGRAARTGLRCSVNVPAGQEKAANSGRMGQGWGGPSNPNQPLLPAQHRAGKGAAALGGGEVR